VKSPRTPFGLALAQLVETLVSGILDATRGVKLGELEDAERAQARAAVSRVEAAPRRKASASTSSKASAGSTAPKASAGSAAPKASAGSAARSASSAPPKRGRPAKRTARSADAAPAANTAHWREWREEEPLPPTEIDAVALLDALERPAAREAPESRVEPEILSEVRPVVTRPSLRSGEDVLQTTTGSLVLRRRRAAAVDE